MLAPSSPEPASKILIVDDTPANLRVVVDYLERHGFSIAVAQDGREALQRAEFVRPDLILLDIMMPEMDGFETCRRLKSNPATRDIPVIFMSALADQDDKLVGFAAGGVDYITKPFQIGEVLARVDNQLALHATQRALTESEQRYRTLVDMLPLAILVETDGRIVFCNDRALHLLGLSAASSLLGTATLDRVPAAARPAARQRLDATLTGQAGPAPLTLTVMRQDGRLVAVELYTATIPYCNAPSVLIVARELGVPED